MWSHKGGRSHWGDTGGRRRGRAGECTTAAREKDIVDLEIRKKLGFEHVDGDGGTECKSNTDGRGAAVQCVGNAAFEEVTMVLVSRRKVFNGHHCVGGFRCCRMEGSGVDD